MAGHVSRFLVLMVMGDVILSPSSAVTFVSAPLLARRHVGDDFSMQWTLGSDPEEYSTSVFFNENNVRVIRHMHGGGETPGPGYEGRVSFYRTSPRGVGFTLTDVALRDAGQYRCRYLPTTEPSIDSSSVLFIFREPSTPVMLPTQYGQIGVPFPGDLTEGDSVCMLCEASSTSLPAADRPAMTYTWTRNGQPIDRDNPPDRHSVHHDTGRLLDISPVRRTDVTYGCTAQEEGSNLVSQTTLNLNVLYPPGAATVTVSPPSQVAQGASLAVTCSLADQGNPSARVVYRSPRGQLTETTNNTLVISDVILDRDDGTWECHGESSAGAGSGATFDITVHVNNAVTIAAVTATVIVAIIVIVVVIVVMVLRRKRRISKRDSTPLYENTTHHDMSLVQTPIDAATEIKASHIEMQHLLSDGTGFQMYSAKVQIDGSLHLAVIKKVKDAAFHVVYSRYLTGQMSVLLNMKHVNVVTMMGFQTLGSDGEYANVAKMASISLVLEPATQGDLHTFLTGQGSGVYQKTVTMETMMGMALGVATGAFALSEVKLEVLHYCLCAKHVLLDGRGVCKLTGFSTAEAVRAREAWEAIRKLKRPVRWMSAETLDHLEHTTKSDVWSFAIFLWELFSLGETPYPGMDDTEVQETVQEGRRLDKPNNCDPATYELMIECWMRNTEKRPGFEDVTKCLITSLSEKAKDSVRPPSGEHTYEAIV